MGKKKKSGVEVGMGKYWEALPGGGYGMSCLRLHLSGNPNNRAKDSGDSPFPVALMLQALPHPLGDTR